MLRTVPLLLLSLICGTAFAQPLQEAASLDFRILNGGDVVIGVRPDRSPFSYRDAAGAAKGFVVEMCSRAINEMARVGGARVAPRIVYRDVTVADRLERVASGDVDLECGVTTITPERMTKVAFSHMTFVAATRLVTKRGDSPNIAGNSSARIALVKNTTAVQVLARWNPYQATVPVANYSECIAAVAKGKAYGCLADDVLAHAEIVAQKLEPQDYSFSNNTFSVEPYGIAMRLGNDAFKAKFNAALAEVYQRGDGRLAADRALQTISMRLNEASIDALRRPGIYLPPL